MTSRCISKIKLVTISYRSFFKKKIHVLKIFNYNLKFFFLKIKKKKSFFFLANLDFSSLFNLHLNYTISKKKIKKNIILKAPNRFKTAREKFQQKIFFFCSSFFFLKITYPSYIPFFFLMLLSKINYFLEYFKFFSFFLYTYSNLLPVGFFTTINFIYRYKYSTLYYNSSYIKLKKLFFNFKINNLMNQLTFFKKKIKKLFKNNFFLKKVNLIFPLKLKKKLIKYYKRKKLNSFNKKSFILKSHSLVSFFSKYKKSFFSTQHKLYTHFYTVLQKKLYFMYRYKNSYYINFFQSIGLWFSSIFKVITNTFHLLNVSFDSYYLFFF